jgi:thiamine-monophosphate kinase
LDFENYFIKQFKSKKIGDDGALVGGMVYSKDAFFENVHFKKAWMSHYQIAAKAMAVNISDAIAMNARPKYALLSVAMPKSITKEQASELARGFLESGVKYGVEIVGGDTISNTKLDITITIISEVKKPLLRNGLRMGNLLAHTGVVGRSEK